MFNWNIKESPILSMLGMGGGIGNKLIGASVPFEATGGTKSTFGSYTYHDYTTTGPNPFVVTSGSTSGFILLVAGGGSGSTNNPGSGGQSGGGAGGVIAAPLTLSEGSYTVVVGSGGASSTQHGNNGTDSTFGPNWVAQGGGAGLNYTPSPVVTQGGSPGGIYGNAISPLNQTNNPALPADSRTYGYGNQGATNGAGPGFGGGGGGGAGGAGNLGIPAGPGVGGAGLPTAPFPWLNGTPFFAPSGQYFAGGGGTGSRAGNGAGGIGGGGIGQHAGGGGGGQPTTGSGGGGGVTASGAGGPGRVIIAYLT